LTLDSLGGPRSDELTEPSSQVVAFAARRDEDRRELRQGAERRVVARFGTRCAGRDEFSDATFPKARRRCLNGVQRARQVPTHPSTRDLTAPPGTHGVEHAME